QRGDGPRDRGDLPRRARERLVDRRHPERHRRADARGEPHDRRRAGAREPLHRDAERGAPLPSRSLGAMAGSSEPLRHVIFRVDRERYALPLPAVREVVVPPPAFTAVPRAPKAVRGVMNLRGRVITVVSLAALLELPAADAGEGRIVLLDRRRRDLGLWVIDVESIEPL